MTWLSLLLACRPDAPVMRRDVYVWQRRWTAEVARAVREGGPLFDGIRPQALAFDATGAAPLQIALDLEALAETQREVTLVVRIEGERPEPEMVAQRLLAEVQRARAASVRISGVEIDFDAPTSQLDAYGRWLSDLRGSLPEDLALSITALPTWTSAAGPLSRALSHVDHAVLQVHAVDPPSRGLFSQERALSFAERFAEISPVPFRVALPAYGASLDPRGAVLSEIDRAETSAAALDLWADPAEVLATARALQRRPLPGYAGELWFRLPVEGDVRAWTLPMLREVLGGRLPLTTISVDAQPSPGGAFDLQLRIEGGRAPGPAEIRITGSCAAADGSSGYLAERSPLGVSFTHPHPPLLRPEQWIAVGWARCLDGWRIEEL